MPATLMRPLLWTAVSLPLLATLSGCPWWKSRGAEQPLDDGLPPIPETRIAHLGSACFGSRARHPAEFASGYGMRVIDVDQDGWAELIYPAGGGLLILDTRTGDARQVRFSGGDALLSQSGFDVFRSSGETGWVVAYEHYFDGGFRETPVICCTDAHGKIRWAFRPELSSPQEAELRAADLDGDGRDEVVVALGDSVLTAREQRSGTLLVLDHAGRPRCQYRLKGEPESIQVLPPGPNRKLPTILVLSSNELTEFAIDLGQADEPEDAPGAATQPVPPP